MIFSKNFKIEELTYTSQPFANVPNIIELGRLQDLVDNILQPLYDLYDKPIKVISGFRSTSVNSAVGGLPDSQHRRGEAVDIKCEDNAKLFHLIKNNLDFDQLRWEGGNDKQPEWIHVSFKRSNNRFEIYKTIFADGEKLISLINKKY